MYYWLLDLILNLLIETICLFFILKAPSLAFEILESNVNQMQFLADTKSKPTTDPQDKIICKHKLQFHFKFNFYKYSKT